MKQKSTTTLFIVATIFFFAVLISQISCQTRSSKKNELSVEQASNLNKAFIAYLNYRNRKQFHSLFTLLPPFYKNYMCNLANIHDNECGSFKKSFSSADSYMEDSIMKTQLLKSVESTYIFKESDTIVVILTVDTKLACNDLIVDKNNCSGNFLFATTDLFFVSNDAGVHWWVIDETYFSQDNPNDSPLYDAFKTSYSKNFVDKIFGRYYSS